MLSILRNKFEDKSAVIGVVLVAIISFLFVFLCSYTTSPLYIDGYARGIEGGDSAHYLTMGKEWLSGKVPYRDIFDHKGPIIYFVNMLGFAICGSATGVFILQLFFMFATFMGIYKIASLSDRNVFYKIIAVLISALILPVTYAGGNMCEEYSLPFIAFSAYFQIKYLMSSDGKMNTLGDHNPKWAFLYGLSFGICFLIKVTQAITICMGVLVIVIILLINKNFKNLLSNALWFIGGFAAISLPFVIYFCANGCLKDFLYTTIIFNVEYKSHFSSWLISTDSGSFVEFIKSTLSYSCCLFSSVLYLYAKKYRMAIYSVACFIIETYLFFSGTAFWHYTMICLFQIPIFLNALSDIRTDKGGFILKSISMFLVLLLSYNRFYSTISDTFYQIEQNSVETTMDFDCLLDLIPDDEKQTLSLYGDQWAKPLLVKEDIPAYYKYYMIQEWVAGFDDKVKNEIHDIYMNGDAKWILCDSSTSVIQDVLDQRYTLIAQNGEYRLFCLNEYSSTVALGIKAITDLPSYLTELKNLDNCTIYMAVKDIQGYSLTQEIIDQMKEVGFTDVDGLLEHEYHSYIGAVSSGQAVVCMMGTGDNEEGVVSYSGEINGHTVMLESRTLNAGNNSIINIDGINYSKNERGFNFVVIDNETGGLVDRVCFDTHVDEFTCIR